MELFNVGNRIMNTYVYEGPAGWVMVDTGYEDSLTAVTDRLRRRGLTLSDLRCVFLTHAHDDHAGFLRALLNICPRLICIASADARPVLAAGRNPVIGGCSSPLARRFCHLMDAMGKREHRFPAIGESYRDRFLFVTPGHTAEAEALLGGQILFTPGHTADSISLRLEDRIFCGDAAMNGFPSRKRITIWVGDPAAFGASWDLLAASGAATLYPAHGRCFPTEDLTRFRADADRLTLLEP